MLEDDVRYLDDPYQFCERQHPATVAWLDSLQSWCNPLEESSNVGTYSRGRLNVRHVYAKRLG